nr:hypothetical protein [Tanacetum cinerariifolium]
SQGASLLWGSSGVSSGSVVEVVEKAGKYGRGGEWGWRENRLTVNNACYLNGEDKYLWGFYKIGPWGRRSGVEVVEWSVEWGRGGEWGCREIRNLQL